jgi:hypothetical protein
MIVAVKGSSVSIQSVLADVLGTSDRFPIRAQSANHSFTGLMSSGGSPMLTATLSVSKVTDNRPANQNETFVSDAEISARVLRIRSGWSVKERLERRREAERRFADLIDALGQI